MNNRDLFSSGSASRLLTLAASVISINLAACGGSTVEAAVNDPVRADAQLPLSTTDDRDGDQVVDALDAFPDDPNEQADRDGDGVGDNTDAYPDDPSRTLPPIAALRRGGQTFLTWVEDAGRGGERYHVYRHDQPITTENLASARQLTARWGALPEGSGRHANAGDDDPARHVIRDRSAPLPDGIGLFVYTTQAGDSAQAYYAVTSIVGGVERTDIVAGVNTLATPVAEAVAPPSAVLVQVRNGGLGRLYTQYMDYSNWNPTLNGYAYNYTVALPQGFDVNRAYPVKIELHAYQGRHRRLDSAEFGWPAIHVLPDDPGGIGAQHTWWYGFARDHDFRTANTLPASGPIVNYTEQRLLRMIDELDRDPGIRIDSSRLHVFGNSMGASGALALGVRYGAIFAGTFGSQPMTDYANSPNFMDEFERIWGRRASGLPILNAGPHATGISRYGLGGDAVTSVWDWQDHGQQLIRRRGERFSYLMFAHGKADTIIDWQTQGRPFIGKLDTARAGFSSIAVAGQNHAWMGFVGIVHSLFSAGYGDLGDFKFRNTLTYPALHRATRSGPLVPGNTGTDGYNLELEWSTPWNTFGADPVDTANRYEITIRSTSTQQQVDITPRNTRAFRPIAGQSLRWRVVAADSGQQLQQGSIVVDPQGLATVPGAIVRTGAGSRLIIEP